MHTIFSILVTISRAAKLTFYLCFSSTNRKIVIYKYFPGFFGQKLQMLLFSFKEEKFMKNIFLILGNIRSLFNL